MELMVISETGTEESLVGMKLSFQPECELKDVPLIKYDLPDKKKTVYDGVKLREYSEIGKKLSVLDKGHNKFIRGIKVHLLVRAPLKWWKQMDQYKVGTTTVSKSTMHTIMKRDIVMSDFSRDNIYPETIKKLNQDIKNKNFESVTDNLPSSYLQTRLVVCNYAVLREIAIQRKNHKLEEWQIFISEFYSQLRNPELLGLDK